MLELIRERTKISQILENQNIDLNIIDYEISLVLNPLDITSLL